MRAVEADGWYLEAEPAEDEASLYVHPVKSGRIPVNPDWPRIYKGDDIFNIVCHDMGVTPRRLLELLSDHH